MNRQSWIIRIALVLGGFGSIGGIAPVEAAQISEHHCVKASVDQVYGLFTRYDQYSKMRGAEYQVGMAGVNVTLISMVKSQAKVVSQNGRDGETLVWIVLQPALVSDASLYPRFLLDCKVKGAGPDAFSQECLMQKDKQHFGLDDLQIRIGVNARDSRCTQGQSGIQIDVGLAGNPGQIDQIKRSSLGAAGMLAPVLGALFDEDAFFRSYFSYIYGEWMKTLQ